MRARHAWLLLHRGVRSPSSAPTYPVADESRLTSEQPRFSVDYFVAGRRRSTAKTTANYVNTAATPVPAGVASMAETRTIGGPSHGELVSDRAATGQKSRRACERHHPNDDLLNGPVLRGDFYAAHLGAAELRHRADDPARVGQRSSDVSAGNFYVFDLARGRRNWRTVFPQTIEVEGDRLADSDLGIRQGRASCDATRQVWNVGREVGARVFNDNGVAHRGYLNFASVGPA